MSALLIEVQSVANDEIIAVEASEFEVDQNGFVGSFYKDCSINCLWLEALQKSDHFFEGMTSIMDIFNNQDILASIVFRLEWCFNNQRSRCLSTLVALTSDELVGMIMLDFFDQVTKKHKSSLEHTHHYQVQMPLLLQDLRVVGVNLICDVADHLFYLFAGI